jgi:urease accessory protein
VRAELAIELRRTGDGRVAARGALALAPYWCRWDGATLWIVGSAATPVGDDDITLSLDVGEGVTASVRSVAATVVYTARGEGTRITTRLRVAAGATLVWQPEPVIVTERARHRAVLVADVAAGGTLCADEVVVFGRTDEGLGGYRSTMDLRRDGEPLSLTSFDSSLPGWTGPGGVDGAKVVGTRLAIGPAGSATAPEATDVDRRTVVLRPTPHCAIATTLASDPASAVAHLGAALPRGAVDRSAGLDLVGGPEAATTHEDAGSADEREGDGERPERTGRGAPAGVGAAAAAGCAGP